MRRWLTIILLLVWTGVAGAQSGPPQCAITGSIVNADNSPFLGVIKFFNPVVQVINNVPINPMQVSTTTDSSGNIHAINLPQGAFFQVTICPNQSAASGCAATFTAIVPAAPTANFGNMAQGTNLIPSVIGSNMSVTGTLSVSGATTLSGATTIGGPTGGLTVNNDILAAGNVNAPIFITAQNTNSGPLATAYLRAVNDTNLSLWMVSDSSGMAAIPSEAWRIPNSQSIYGDQLLNIAATGAGQIRLWSNNVGVGLFYIDGGTNKMEGLALPGYAARFASNTGETGFSIGDAYMTGNDYATLNISTASTWDGTNWYADPGAGSGMSLLGLGKEGGGLYYSGPLSAGALVTWSPVFTYQGANLQLVHLVNNQNYGIPTVSGGTLQSGSRDTFGEIVANATGANVTLNFALAYANNPYCVAISAGAAAVWWAQSRTSTSVTFSCFAPGGGTCGAGLYLDYFCFSTS